MDNTQDTSDPIRWCWAVILGAVPHHLASTKTNAACAIRSRAHTGVHHCVGPHDPQNPFNGQLSSTPCGGSQGAAEAKDAYRCQLPPIEATHNNV